MAAQEKQKRGLVYGIYKAGTGIYSHHTKKKESDPAIPSVLEKKPVSRNWLSRKPKAVSNKEQGRGGVLPGEEVAGDIKMVEFEARKSVLSNPNTTKMVEARKSVSHIETNMASVASFLQVKVLVSDMPSSMQVHAFRCARRTYDSLEKFSSKHMAFNVKKEFDHVYGPAWHCIVGSSFGSYVTHSTGCFLYFSIENLYILLFKTKIRKVSD